MLQKGNDKEFDRIKVQLVMKMNVRENKSNGLCCSCGICSAVCLRKAITYERSKGMYIPVIDDSKCNSCGSCVEICPGLNQVYSSGDSLISSNEVAGRNVLVCNNAWSRDENIRHISASGGVTTTIIETLLGKGMYDCVFCVDKYSYDKQLKAVKYSYQEFVNQRNNEWSTPKSRYLPVSHEDTVKYMINNKDSKVIIVAVPCVLNSLCRIIDKYKLKRNNYLLIGLFCERNFQYNINDYFSNLIKGKTLTSLNFKNKESGGWPGNLKLFFSDNTYVYKDKSLRTTAKPYFQPERCLYCIDKLAACADIALGDNYTGVDSSELGSNSVIVRTDAGLNAWCIVERNLEVRDISFKEIEQAEVMDERLKNVYYAELKKNQLKTDNFHVFDINSGIFIDSVPYMFENMYKTMLSKISVGEKYIEQPKLYHKEVKRIFFKKRKNYLKSKIKGGLVKFRAFITRMK